MVNALTEDDEQAILEEAVKRAEEMKRDQTPGEDGPAPPPMTFLEPDGTLLPRMDWLMKYGEFVIQMEKAAGVHRDPGILWEMIAAKMAQPR